MRRGLSTRERSLVPRELGFRQPLAGKSNEKRGLANYVGKGIGRKRKEIDRRGSHQRGRGGILPRHPPGNPLGGKTAFISGNSWAHLVLRIARRALRPWTKEKEKSPVCLRTTLTLLEGLLMWKVASKAGGFVEKRRGKAKTLPQKRGANEGRGLARTPIKRFRRGGKKTLEQKRRIHEQGYEGGKEPLSTTCNAATRH